MRLRCALLGTPILLLLVVATVSLACAAPTPVATPTPPSKFFPNGDYDFNETTGLLNIPVARTLAPGAFWGGFSFAKYGGATPDTPHTLNADFVFGPNDGTMWMQYGVVPGFEVSAMFEHGPFSGGPGRPFTANPGVDIGAKYLVMDETDSLPAIAIGCQNMTALVDHPDFGSHALPQYNDRSAFVVASKTVDLGDLPVDLHVGYGDGRFSYRIFYGGEIHISKEFSAIGEFDGVLTNVGLRYVPDWMDNRFRLTFMIQQSYPAFQFGYQFGNGSPLVGGEPPSVQRGLTDY